MKGYTYQNHIQVGAIIQLASSIINNNGLDIKRIILQSDNVSGLSSSNPIPLIYNMDSCNKKTFTYHF